LAVARIIGIRVCFERPNIFILFARW